MNYRHHFHAGNFADLVKHALWLALLSRLQTPKASLSVLDTHAGAGVYDLEGDSAVRSGEAQGGVGRLMEQTDAPEPLTRLREAVMAENPGGRLQVYPGSAALTLAVLRPGDRYLGCELRMDDFQALEATLKTRRRPGGASASAEHGDGYAAMGRSIPRGRPPGGPGPAVLRACLIDPPFERGDERERILAAVAGSLTDRPPPAVAVWAPLKDLESFDGLLRGLEALRPASLTAAEAWLRAPVDPMRMNGAAMIFVNAPDLSREAETVCSWVARVCGEAGGRGRVRRLTPGPGV